MKVTLATLDQKLDYVLSKLEEHANQDRLDFTNIHTALDGNGSPGLKMRVDRLEQIESNRKWHIRALWSAMVTGVVGYFLKGV